ncbi:2-C-methyl-D-erythritol 4-phosphate cytidylyltransferase [hydrothermal vent metagenome]|uniref:2-C-methyl-D-erythritol 4-phosphate cytidylyltransferase n=1 Tax=hydrothermal vent metagenome TaxID=652676 RepID=A0A3B0XX87_9ZZZZ
MSDVSLALEKQYWVVIPAAGAGKRMQADRPKQYLPLLEKTVIEHTLDRLLAPEAVAGAVLSISEGDAYWPALGYKTEKPLLVARGGKARCDSVLNALALLQQTVNDAKTVWVLVHDAARPCVRAEDIAQLIERGSLSDDGGLLALPVRDTMKRSSTFSAKCTANNAPDETHQVQQTIDRTALWHALTPQLFRLDLLLAALHQAAKNNQLVTDDASAMELAGYHPQLIEAHEDNIKITRAFDLQLAELFLLNQLS